MVEDWIRLHEDTAPGLIEMLGIPGMGPKKIQRLNQEFGVESIAELKEVAEDGKIAPLSGFGAKSQQKILDGIELLARFRSRRRLDIGLMYGLAFESRISEIKTSKEQPLRVRQEEESQQLATWISLYLLNPNITLKLAMMSFPYQE